MGRQWGGRPGLRAPCPVFGVWLRGSSFPPLKTRDKALPSQGSLTGSADEAGLGAEVGAGTPGLGQGSAVGTQRLSSKGSWGAKPLSSLPVALQGCPGKDTGAGDTVAAWATAGWAWQP